MLVIDTLAKRYGVLPSSILKNDIVELQFDILVADTAINEEIKAAKKSKLNSPKGKNGR